MSKPPTTTEEKLLKAAKDGDVTMLRILEWRPVNYNARDRRGNTALLLACENALNKSEVVQALAQHRNVDINARNDAGQTAFHKLAANGGARSVKVLLDAHANPLIADNTGRPPAHAYLVSGFHDGLAALLDSHYGRTRIPKMLDGEGNTLLHLAAVHAPELAVTLIARGVPQSTRNNAGYLPEDLCEDEKVKRLLRAMRMAAERSARVAPEPADVVAQGESVPQDKSVTLQPSGHVQGEDNSEQQALADFASKALDYLASIGKDKPGPSM